jgi:Bacterial SH3 domain
MRLLGLLCAYAAVTPLMLAGADPRRTLEDVTLRKKPGEKEAAVARVSANTPVTVLAVEGRWLLVRVNNASGYLTRTTVSEPDAVAAEPAGRWSASRRGDGKLDGKLGAGAVGAGLQNQPLEPARAALAPRAPSGTLAMRADLGIGFRALGMTLSSNAEGGLTNYVLDADAAAATLDVDVAIRLAGRVFVAADARAAASASSPGIDYPGPTAPAGKIPFRTLASDAGVRIGLRAHHMFDLAVRAGGHYDAFVSASVKNAGKLPRESLAGATLGGRADIAPEGSRFTVTARFDVLVLGARTQTPGLEDGTASTSRALWGGLTMRYALGSHVAVFGGYDFGRASTAWSGMSVRQPGATRTQRVDTTQLVQLGISTAL